MEEIQVGDYVRTYKGKIYKVTNVYVLKITCGHTSLRYNDITKHSSDIIDLIEEGDYVNGYEVHEFDDEEGNLYLGFSIYDDALMDCITEVRPLSTVDIKSIVTKEQFESMKYVIGE